MPSEIGLKVVLRFLFGGGAVALSAIVAKLLGDRIGGIFAAFPAVYISAVVAVGLSVPAASALTATVEVSKGALVGMSANIFSAALAAVSIPRHGWKKGLALAIAVWLMLAGIIYAAAFSLGWVR
jgi:uncharacterized membrane protein (GlpM family)